MSASYTDICAYLDGVPAASRSWAEAFYCGRLSMEAVQTFVQTMREDAESPLRQAEAGILSKELMRLTSEVSYSSAVGGGNGRIVIKLNVVLSPSEQTKVVRLVQGFCQPEFVAGGRFGNTSHAIMNAVRRATAGYTWSKIPSSVTVLEVGPDTGYWVVTSDEVRTGYKGARPILTPRDSVRLEWAAFLADEKLDAVAKDRMAQAFERKKVQEMQGSYEYIVSQDSNYDIDFNDMPVVMQKLNTRAWMGVMVRAKGVSRRSRVTSGKLDLMGVTFRVDWEADRIDFRHPSCSAFGYSHRASQYLLYEEYNGYVWDTPNAHYVYSKGPETNSELLFFSVFRVPTVMGYREPSFVEHPQAGRTRIKSVWAVGDESSGVPKSFAEVVFHVDSLNFSKVLEKRRAVDFKGSLAATVVMVRSTNVRFWLNGTPLGASQRIEARLVEAVAVVVELMAMNGRLDTNKAFDAASMAYKASLNRNSGIVGLVETIFSMRWLSGNVVGPISNIWESLRSTLIDKSLACIDDLNVEVEVEGAHIEYEVQDRARVTAKRNFSVGDQCLCRTLADLRQAEAVAVSSAIGELREARIVLEAKLPCRQCEIDVFEDIEEAAVVSDEDSSSEGSTTEIGTASTAITDVSVSWRECDGKASVERAAMEELVGLETHLIRCALNESRIDAVKLMEAGLDEAGVLAACTTRTQHCFVEVFAGRCIRRIGAKLEGIGALYDIATDSIIPTRGKGSVIRADVPNGYYYTCNRLLVWNGPEIIAAINHVLDYGRVAHMRELFSVNVGVPGAGKTYGMVQSLAERCREEPNGVLFVSATNRSVTDAKKYAKKFGYDVSVINARFMTVDSYLMHSKCASKLVCVDEYSMLHAGKIDAVVSMAGAEEVRLFGDSRQIPFDAFCADFAVEHASVRGSVDKTRVKFSPETHRLSEKGCAPWVDEYPAIYPCECCTSDEKDRAVFKWSKISSIEDVQLESGVRYHTYKQDDKDDVRLALGMREDVRVLKDMENGGISTVHEDQGASHNRVHTVRVHADYDKAQNSRNPSLFNRVNYVLTDMTRTRGDYEYSTLSDERDEIIKRVEMANSVDRIRMVRNKEGGFSGSIIDLV